MVLFCSAHVTLHYGRSGGGRCGKSWQTMIEHDLHPTAFENSVMVELEEGNALCKREAAWVLLNMCECSREPGETIIPEIVGHGVIAAVCESLSSDSDAGKARLCGRCHRCCLPLLLLLICGCCCCCCYCCCWCCRCCFELLRCSCRCCCSWFRLSSYPYCTPYACMLSPHAYPAHRCRLLLASPQRLSW